MVLATAAVVRRYGTGFELEEIDVPDPGPFDVRVRIRAVGICHTDVAVSEGHRSLPVPVVLGHEAAGVVDAVGSAVTTVAVGDRVAVSFASCGRCTSCSTGQPALCSSALELNFSGVAPPGTPSLRSASDGHLIHGSFFGQSSFASHALVRERAVVRLPTGFPLALAAPLGCGVQTGAGAVWRSVGVRPGDTVVVNGVGSVGLSAVMAAAVSGAGPIVATDVTPARLALARELGATHTIDGSTADGWELVRHLSPDGADAVIDTTAIPSVIERSLESLRLGGTLAMIASGRGDDSVRLSAFVGRRVVGVMEGNSVPSQSINQLSALHQAGRFPLERLVTTYPFEEIETAVRDMRAGTTIKPVLIFGDEDD